MADIQGLPNPVATDNEEAYLAMLAGVEDLPMPKIIANNKEFYLRYIVENGGIGGGGAAVIIKGHFDAASGLPETAEVGDAYTVGTEKPYDVYIYDKDGEWQNIGPIQGPKGEPGEVLVASVNGKTGEVVLNATDIKLTTNQQTIQANLIRIDEELGRLEDDKQDKLTAGTNISIDENNVISVTGGTGGGEWGSITGTLSDQTDLQEALNGKANASDINEIDYEYFEPKKISGVDDSVNEVGYYINNSGIKASGAGRSITPFIPVKNGEIYYRPKDFTIATYSDTTGTSASVVNVYLKESSTSVTAGIKKILIGPDEHYIRVDYHTEGSSLYKHYDGLWLLNAKGNGYVLTSDTTIDSSKTYYSRARSSDGKYWVYSQVVNPVISSLPTYYEFVPVLDEKAKQLKNDFAKENIYSPLINKKIVCFGDSIAGNFRAPISYPAQLGKTLRAKAYNIGFSGCMMSNFSSSGTGDYDAFSMCNLADAVATGDYSAQDAAYLSKKRVSDKISIDNLKSVDFSEVYAITIEYGTNDFGVTICKPLDDPNDKFSKNTFLGALRYSIERIQQAYPHIKIYVVSPLYRVYKSEYKKTSDTAIVQGKTYYTRDNYTYTEVENPVASELSNYYEYTGNFEDSDNSIHRVSDSTETLMMKDYIVGMSEVCKEYHTNFINIHDTLGSNKNSYVTYLAPELDDGEVVYVHPTEVGLEAVAHVIAGGIVSNLNSLTMDSLDYKEAKSNKVTSISSSSTNAQYPSAKCVYDIVGDVESLMANLYNGGGAA